MSDKVKLYRNITMMIAVIVGLGVWDNHRHLYHAGRAESCTGGSLFSRAQAEILEYGLQDVRGMTTDDSGRYIYVAEANRPVLIYDTKVDSERDPFINDDSQDSMCPDEACENFDARDLAIEGNHIFITEHGKGKIFGRMLNEKHSVGKLEPAETDSIESIRSPSGVWVTPATLFVTVDMPPLVTTTKDAAKTTGALYVVDRAGTQKPVQVSAGLHRPSGVLATGAVGPVYVADDDDADDSVRWSIFEKRAQGWVPAGFLASVPKMRKSLPKFLGIGFSPKRKMIFAAGPSGLYAFSLDGASIGRMIFDEPVSGVAVGPEAIYLVVGHMLCRIPFEELREAEKDLRSHEPPDIAQPDNAPLPPPVPPTDFQPPSSPPKVDAKGEHKSPDSLRHEEGVGSKQPGKKSTSDGNPGPGSPESVRRPPRCPHTQKRSRCPPCMPLTGEIVVRPPNYHGL
jgi:hypothetical protein